MTDDLIGKKIGGYEIQALIGHGGMATVYRAHQVSMNRTVALKVLPRQYVNDDTYMQRFHREVKIVAQLEHRNIVPVHDYGEDEGQPYIVMRYMSGGSVDDLLANGALDLEQVCDIIEQVAPALDFAHSRNVLHRDLKPSNVLMDDNGGAFLTDFGIARILGETNSTITTQGVVGTPSYMSPEQAQGQPLDNRSDIYSLGVMLFEMTTGRRPFDGDTPYSIAVMHVTQPPPPPRSINPQLPVAVENVILKAMSKHRESRYDDAVSLAQALAQAVSSPSVNLYDTQPGMPLPQELRSQDLRSQEPPLQEALQPPPLAQTPPPAVYVQPSSGAPAYVPASGTSSNFPAVQRRPAKRKPNLLFSAALGGVLGCGLLTLLVIIAALLISNANQQTVIDAQTLTETITTTPEPDATDNPARSTPVAGVDSVTPTRQTPRAAATTTVSASGGVASGSKLVYSADRNNNFDVYVLDLESGTETRLTNASPNDIYPVASPDGTRVAFISNSDGDYEIFVMDITGRSQRRLTQNSVNDRYPAWSPDGAWIVYSSDTRGDGNFDLYRVPADGSGEPEVVYSDGARNSFPAWGSNGLVFTNGSNRDASTWELARLALDEAGQPAGEIEFLTENDMKDWAPVFAPDGSIYFLTEGDGHSAIARIDADGDDPQVIYDGAGYEWGLAVSPNGETLAFTSNTTGRDEVYQIAIGSEESEQMTTSGAMSPSWAGT